MIEPNYTYKATIVSVYDGDTVRADIDCGFGITHKNIPLRLYGINAPEMRGESKYKGTKSRDYLRSLILDKAVIIKTYKDQKEKYGRYLADIYLDGKHINKELLDKKLVVPYLL